MSMVFGIWCPRGEVCNKGGKCLARGPSEESVRKRLSQHLSSAPAHAELSEDERELLVNEAKVDSWLVEEGGETVQGAEGDGGQAWKRPRTAPRGRGTGSGSSDFPGQLGAIVERSVAAGIEAHRAKRDCFFPRRFSATRRPNRMGADQFCSVWPDAPMSSSVAGGHPTFRWAVHNRFAHKGLLGNQTSDPACTSDWGEGGRSFLALSPTPSLSLRKAGLARCGGGGVGSPSLGMSTWSPSATSGSVTIPATAAAGMVDALSRAEAAARQASRINMAAASAFDHEAAAIAAARSLLEGALSRAG